MWLTRQLPVSLFGVFVLFTLSSASLCDPGWIHYDTSCYKHVSTHSNWMAANDECTRMGANLVVIKDRDENDFLYANFGTNFWIGYTDRERERHFQWVYGPECSDYRNFDGEPGNNEYNDCVAFGYKYGKQNFDNWENRHCYTTSSFVCEKQISYEDLTPPSYRSTCPDDIHLLALPNGTKSFQLDWTPPTWTDNSFCPVTNIKHSQYLPGYVLTIPEGVLSTSINVTYTAIDRAGNQNTCFFRVSASVTNFECLNGGTPVETNDPHCLCLSGFTGLLCEIQISSLECFNGGTLVELDDSAYCLCPSGFIGSSCEINDYSCDPGWINSGKSCYKFVPAKMYWATAREECLKMGADLVVIKDQAENDFLHKLNIGDRFWIGFSNQQNEEYFEWVSESECSNYTNFAPGQPDRGYSREYCVRFGRSNYERWNDIFCYSTLGYVCEKHFFEDTTPPSYGSTCQDDVNMFALPNGTKSFQLDWTPPTWTDDSLCPLTLLSNQYSPGYVLEIPEGAFSASINVTYTAMDSTGNSNQCSFRISTSIFECLNGGTVVTSNDTDPHCLCLSGFSGLSCEINNITALCDPGWLFYDGSCYKYVPTRADWNTASAECRKMGAKLVVIKDQAENTFFYNAYFGTDFWIGYSDRITEGYYNWIYGEECSYYTNFREGEPNNGYNDEDCVAYQETAQWYDERCGNLLPYVCEKRLYTDTTPPSYGSTCPDDVNVVALPDDYEVFRLDWTPPTWTDDSLCPVTSVFNRYYPGYRLEIPEGALNAFINVTYTATDRSGNSNTCSFRMSVSRYPFECLNGGTMVDPDGPNPYCICSSDFSGVSCEHPAFSCEAGWMSYGTSCYKLVSDEGNWMMANDGCLSMGANLVVIKDVAENAFLYNALFKKDFWIGYTDREREGYFEWVHGSECSDYTNFLPGEPNNAGYGEDCVIYKSSSGQWNDENCIYYRPAYVCEKPFFKDTIPPSYGSTCPDGVHLLTSSEETKSFKLDWSPPTWTDDSRCPLDITNSQYSPGYVLEIPEGAFSASINVSYTATDSAGNSDTCFFRMSATKILLGNQCRNGGNTTISSGALYCACPPGFTGLYCEFERDSFSQCLNGGTLVESKSTDSYCLCLPGFSGLSCEINICLDNQCENNGTCAVDPISPGGYVCLCSEGFSGRFCQE